MTEFTDLFTVCENPHDFLVFLRFCAERLEEDQTVQEIWSA